MKSKLTSARHASIAKVTTRKFSALPLNRLATAVALAAAVGSPAAFSQEDASASGGFDFRAAPAHWYVGGNYGRTTESVNNGKVANSIIGGGLTDMEIDDSDRGYKVFVGYQFNHYFAMEAGYADLGDVSTRVTRNSTPGLLLGETQYQGYNVDLVGTLPLTSRWSAFARVGAFHYEAEENFVGTQGLATTLNRDDKSTGYKFGAGLEYSFTERLSARIEAERYRIEDMQGDNGSVNLYSLGLVYRFGDRAATVTKMDEPAKSVALQQNYCSKMDIQFEIDRADITRAEAERLHAAGAFLKKYPDTKAVITGHADSVGGDQYNLNLSQRRADNVKQNLVGQQINAGRITTVARGEDMPAESNASESGKRENRRVNTTIDCVKDVAGLTLPEEHLTAEALVEFDDNSAVITDSYRGALERAAQYLRDNPKVTAHIEGHSADSTSTAKAQELSERRAQNVADYLVKQFGIERSRLTAEGFGKTRRIAYNTSKEGKQQNRRVNIVLSNPR